MPMRNIVVERETDFSWRVQQKLFDFVAIQLIVVYVECAQAFATQQIGGVERKKPVFVEDYADCPK